MIKYQRRLIAGFDDYEIDTSGDVWSFKNGAVRKLKTPLSEGYPVVGLCKDGKSKNYRIHQLVAQAFIPNPENSPWTLHKNGCRTDNRADNLYWGTGKDNALDAVRHGTSPGFQNKHAVGEMNRGAILNVSKVSLARLMYNNFHWPITKITSILGKTWGVKRYAIADSIANRTWKHI